MKKVACLVLALFMLSACGKSDTVSKEDYDAVVSELNELKEQNEVDETEPPSETAQPSSTANDEDGNYTGGSVASGEKEPDVDVESIKANIDIRAVPTMDDTVCAFITNNNDIVIDELDVQINYLDESGQVIDMGEDWHDMVLPGYTVVSRIDAPDDYASMDVQCNIEIGAHPGYENHSNDVEVTANQGEDCVIVQITNNSDVEIEEVEYVVVFYKGDEIVSVEYPQDVNDVGAGETVTEKVGTSLIDAFLDGYDRFEVYLNQAHTF